MESRWLQAAGRAENALCEAEAESLLFARLNALENGRGGMRETEAVFPHCLLSAHPSSDGELRWYAVRVPAGCEDDFAEKCRKELGADVLEDCFAPRRERYVRRQGAWQVELAPLFSGHVFAASRDAAALAEALGRLPFSASIAGGEGCGPVPLAAGVQAWLASAFDGAHVLRASEGRIEGGVLTVERGPLRGGERVVRKIDRHRRTAYVELGDGGGFLLRAALTVPKKG